MNNNNQNSESKVENSVNSTPQDNKPKIVEIVPTNEVNQSNVESNQEVNNDNVNKEKKKSGHPVFLVFLIIFLFAFVYFLPNITKFITDYMNEKTGVNELRSGTMTCQFVTSSENLDYTYDFSFKYEKNRLKSSRMTTTSRLADTAIDNSVLATKNNSCELLKVVLDNNDIGMTVDCSVSAAVQVTTQTIDYEELNMDFITGNITEFEGFYPEYELDQSITVIQQELEKNGYTCRRNE